MFSLPNRFEVVLVFPIEDKQPAHEKQEVLDVLKAMGEITSGASTSEGVGYWQSDTQAVFERAIHIYTFYEGEATLEQLKSSVFPVVTTWACKTSQEAVAFEINGILEIWDTADLLAETYEFTLSERLDSLKEIA